MIGNNLLIQMEKEDLVTESGIHLLEKEKLERGQKGIVIARGPKCLDIDLYCKVHFERSKYTEMKIDGKDYAVIAEDEIMGIEYE